MWMRRNRDLSCTGPGAVCAQRLLYPACGEIPPAPPTVAKDHQLPRAAFCPVSDPTIGSIDSFKSALGDVKVGVVPGGPNKKDDTALKILLLRMTLP